MTEFTPAVTNWRAVKFDGTNLQAVQDAISEAGVGFLVQDVNAPGQYFLFDEFDLSSNTFSLAGFLQSSYVPLPWVMWKPRPDSYTAGEIAVRPDDGTGDSPKGFAAV